MTELPASLKSLSLIILSTLFFYSCAAPPGPIGGVASTPMESKSSRTMAPSADTPWNAPVIEERPGLGTGFGKKVDSKLSSTYFTRASKKPYGKVDTIYYNDKEGIDAMAGGYRWGRKGLQKSSNGLVEWGVKQGVGTLKSYYRNGKRYVEGENDRTYSIVIKNVCHSRLEAVVSVDGLDVINGRAASVSNQGYIIAPGKTLTIKGFRTSQDAVAAFKFSSVSDSYSAQKHGTTRNVGVIGLALFAEKGYDPWKWNTRELENRNSASPFAEPL